MPAPIRAASSRIERIRSSGANGLPATIPIAASWPARSGSSASAGSSATIEATSSKNEKSLRVDAVELGLGEVQELGRRRVVGLRQRVDAGGLQVLHAAERADDEPVRVGRRPGDEVAVGDVAVVTGRQDQVLAALPLVRAGEADVGDVALPDVVDEAQGVRGRLDHQSARRP